MKRLKHILVLAGLLIAAIPCIHTEHAEHRNEVVSISDVSCCHACDRAGCPKELDVEKERVSPAVSVYRQCPAQSLFIVNAAAVPYGTRALLFNPTLSQLKTVRLLT